MKEFDQKIHDAFPGLVVRKDLVKEVKGNAIVPSYVLEYLLGQYCATDDQETVKAGIESVKSILAAHYVHRNEANKIRAEISERGQKKVIDTISVTFNEKKDTYEASFSNLGISKVLVDSDTIKKHQKLLVNGVWCIATVSYQLDEETKDSSPWHIENLKPIQLSNFDFDMFLAGRKQFTSDEWIDVLMQSIGFNPEMFSKRLKLLHLLRLVPFVERNYNLIELGPKGTGKSHIYSEMSPYGMLLSGGEVTVAKLFVNNNRNQLGLVGFWDVVAFDEFAGQAKKVDKALVDIMKNYMANKSFSRGIETMHAEASMVFVGNTKHTVPYMLKNSDLFEELPSAYHDSAFIDRIHAFVPGWEFDSIRFDMFSDGYGFIVDYLAEMLRYMRNRDYSNIYQDYFTLSSDITTRDKDGINKTFSGLMKLIYPNGEATKEEAKEILEFAIEQRKRVKDQLVRIDATFYDTEFSYLDNASKEKILVLAREEKEFPVLYKKKASETSQAEQKTQEKQKENTTQATPNPLEPNAKILGNLFPSPKAGNFSYEEDQTGVSYEKLFGEYLEGATQIEIQDPYIIKPYQTRNLMEFLEVVYHHKKPEDEVSVTLLTKADRDFFEDQDMRLSRIKDSAALIGIDFEYSYDGTDTIHDRNIVLNNGWKIILGRGLDIFQVFDTDMLSFASRVQEIRKCKAFEITYCKGGE